MNLFELSAKISVDDSNFKKSMENAQKVSKNVANAVQQLQSPLDNAKSGFNAIAHPVETAKENIEKLKNATEAIRHPIEAFKNKVSDASTALETKRNKLSVLSAAYDSAKNKVADITKEFNKSSKESGTSSEKTQELAKKLNEAEKEAEEAKKELDNYSESVSKAGKNSDSASNGVGNFASKLGKGLATAGKIGVAAIGAASTAIVALGKIGLDYNSQMEQYTTNFTTMLGSQEAAVQKVQELKEFAASTPLSMDDLAKGTQTLLAFGVESENSTGILRQLGDIALGDADKMQRLSTAFGKATASGKVTGDTVQQMIDAGWNPLIKISQSAGETMEETQKRMSAGKISVEELQAAMEAVTSGTGQFAGGMESASHTTQGLISTLQDNAKALVGEVFMPISDGLLGEVLPTAIDAISQLTTAYKEEGLSGMISAAGEIIGAVITEVVDRVPEFLSIAGEIVASIGSGIMSQSDLLIQNAFDLILVIADGLIQGSGGLLDSAVELVEKLAMWIEEYSNVLGEKAVTLIVTLAESIVTNLPKLAVAALQIMVSLATGIIKNIPELIKKVPTIISKLVSAFSSAMPSIVEVGKNIVRGIWQGISALGGWLKSKVSDFLGGIVRNVKGVLGIASPSKVFASIGGYMAEGLGEGWDAEYDRISQNIKSGLNFGTSTVDFESSGFGAMTASIGSQFSDASSSPITIIVQSVLDKKVIGESTYKYIRQRDRETGR